MSGKKILVVDDSASVRQQVSHALTHAGFEIIEAVDGKEGVSRVHETPDLAMIISDVNMPVMNGLEMLEELRSCGKTVPVVMLTTEGQPDLIKRAKEAGAKGWIVKPFKPELLLGAVQKITS